MDSSSIIDSRLHINPEGMIHEPAYCVFIDVRLKSAEALWSRPHWLLALTLPFSRSDRALTAWVSVPGVPRKETGGLRLLTAFLGPAAWPHLGARSAGRSTYQNSGCPSTLIRFRGRVNPPEGP